MVDYKIIRRNDPIGSFELQLPHDKKDHKNLLNSLSVIFPTLIIVIISQTKKNMKPLN